MNSGIWIAIIAVIIIVGGAWWYMNMTPASPTGTPTTNTNIDYTPDNTSGPSSDTSDTGANVNVNGQVTTGGTNVSGSATVGVTKEFTITNSGMSFTTKSLSVNSGDRVKITFKNTGGTHDFRVDGYNVGTRIINAGQQETFEFTADTAGTFEYFCSVGNHRANGMKGVLTVQ